MHYLKITPDNIPDGIHRIDMAEILKPLFIAFLITTIVILLFICIKLYQDNKKMKNNAPMNTETKIRELKELKEKELITEEQYQDKIKQILEEI